MLTVAVAVGEVVDDIDNAGSQTKNAERRNRAQHEIELEKVANKNNGREDKEVFDPLAGAQGDEDVFEHNYILSIAMINASLSPTGTI